MLTVRLSSAASLSPNDGAEGPDVLDERSECLEDLCASTVNESEASDSVSPGRPPASPPGTRTCSSSFRRNRSSPGSPTSLSSPSRALPPLLLAAGEAARRAVGPLGARADAPGGLPLGTSALPAPASPVRSVPLDAAIAGSDGAGAACAGSGDAGAACAGDVERQRAPGRGGAMARRGGETTLTLILSLNP